MGVRGPSLRRADEQQLRKLHATADRGGMEQSGVAPPPGATSLRVMRARPRCCATVARPAPGWNSRPVVSLRIPAH